MGSRPKSSTILLLDGDLKLYRRAGIRRWQATFKLKSRWVRVSTGHHDMAEATIAARDLFYKYRYMEQHGLPTLTKSFKTVALWAMDRMRVNRRAKLTPYRRPILTPPFGSLAVIPVVDRRGPRTTTHTVRCAGGGVRGRSLLTHRVNRRGWGSGGRGFRLSSGF